MTAKELKEKAKRKWGYEWNGGNDFKNSFDDFDKDIMLFAEQLCREQREISADKMTDLSNVTHRDLLTALPVLEYKVKNAPMPEI